MGPKRQEIEFEEGTEARSLGDMIWNPQYFRKVANKRAGWESLANGAFILYRAALSLPGQKQLLLGRVMDND